MLVIINFINSFLAIKFVIYIETYLLNKYKHNITVIQIFLIKLIGDILTTLWNLDYNIWEI